MADDDMRDPLSIAISQQQAEIALIKRQLEGDPTLRSKGLVDRLELVENGLKELHDALEDMEVEKKLAGAYRKAFVAGLGALGILSASILWIVYRVLEVISSGG